MPASQRQGGAQSHSWIFRSSGQAERKGYLISSINDRREGTPHGEGESIPGIAASWACTDERRGTLPCGGEGTPVVGGGGEIVSRVLRNPCGPGNAKLMHLIPMH